jgi:hypothetical protein
MRLILQRARGERDGNAIPDRELLSDPISHRALYMPPRRASGGIEREEGCHLVGAQHGLDVGCQYRASGVWASGV